MQKGRTPGCQVVVAVGKAPAGEGVRSGVGAPAPVLVAGGSAPRGPPSGHGTHRHTTPGETNCHIRATLGDIKHALRQHFAEEPEVASPTIEKKLGKTIIARQV